MLPRCLFDGMEADVAVDLFYDMLWSAITDHIPTVYIKRKFPPWFDRDLRCALREKEAAFRQMKRSRDDESVENFRSKRRMFKILSDAKYNEYLVGLTEDFKTDPKRFWSFLKCLKGVKKGLSVLKDGNADITDDTEKANVMNRAFSAKFTDPHVAEFPTAPVFDVPNLTTIDCDANTVRTVLESIPVNKACGPDGISARIIYECREELVLPLTKLCSLSFPQGTFPARFKQANIVPIFKKGDVKDPKNYRAVSLIPLFGKVLEKVAYL